VNEMTGPTPDRCAALAAPQIERLTLAVVHASIKRAGPQVMQSDVPRNAIDIIGQLRTGLAERPVSRAGLSAIYRYRDADEIRRNINILAAASIIKEADDGTIQATNTGRRLIAAMYDTAAQAAAELWSAHRQEVAVLNEFAGRLVVAGVASGGDAYAALAPPYEPTGAAAELLLHHRLAVLRYHRADAHASAWRAAGHTAETIRHLAAGPERDRIEAETNRRSGQPYATLNAAECSRFVSGLIDLPGEP
jgi:hypothetical protein